MFICQTCKQPFFFEEPPNKQCDDCKIKIVREIFNVSLDVTLITQQPINFLEMITYSPTVDKFPFHVIPEGSTEHVINTVKKFITSFSSFPINVMIDQLEQSIFKSSFMENNNFKWFNTNINLFFLACFSRYFEKREPLLLQFKRLEEFSKRLNLNNFGHFDKQKNRFSSWLKFLNNFANGHCSFTSDLLTPEGKIFVDMDNNFQQTFTFEKYTEKNIFWEANSTGQLPGYKPAYQAIFITWGLLAALLTLGQTTIFGLPAEEVKQYLPTFFYDSDLFHFYVNQQDTHTSQFFLITLYNAVFDEGSFDLSSPGWETTSTNVPLTKPPSPKSQRPAIGGAMQARTRSPSPVIPHERIPNVANKVQERSDSAESFDIG
jgi:hypothetical protein